MLTVKLILKFSGTIVCLFFILIIFLPLLKSELGGEAKGSSPRRSPSNPSQTRRERLQVEHPARRRRSLGLVDQTDESQE